MAKTEFEKISSNQIKITVDIDGKTFDAALQKAYLKVKSSLQIQGFRKGKVPRKVAERAMGKQLFYNEGIEILIDDTFPGAVEEYGCEIVGEPTFKLEKADDTGVIYSATAFVKPEVKLGDYIGLKYTKKEVSCTEEEIDEQIQAVREQNATTYSVKNRAVKNEDVIKLDFEGKIDGVAFEGGKGEDYPLAIGSGMFIPGFEEQLIGVMPENNVTVTVTFPENYAQKDLCGKEAVFECYIREIIEADFPEVNDEYVKKIADCDSVEEYREKMKEAILEAKQQEEDRASNEELMNGLIEVSEMDIPEIMITDETDRMVNGFLDKMEKQGMNPEQYFEMTGTSADALREEMKPHAGKKVRGKLVLEQVAREQGVTVTEEEVDAELENVFAELNLGKSAAELRNMVGDGIIKNMKSDLAKQKAQQWIIEHAVAVEADAE